MKITISDRGFKIEDVDAKHLVATLEPFVSSLKMRQRLESWGFREIEAINLNPF